MENFHPKIAVVDGNTLAAIGLRQMLQAVMPSMMQVDVFGSFAELEANEPDGYVHYFVAMNLVLENRNFFLEHRRKTIVPLLPTRMHRCATSIRSASISLKSSW